MTVMVVVTTHNDQTECVCPLTQGSSYHLRPLFPFSLYYTIWANLLIPLTMFATVTAPRRSVINSSTSE